MNITERLKECTTRIGTMCGDGRPPKMSIPVREDDDDIFITGTCLQAAREIEQLRGELARYRWLFGARTAEECASEDVGLKPPFAQDFVLADLSCFYSHKELVDDMIDTAMKGETK